MIRSLVISMNPTCISPLGIIVARTFSFRTNANEPHNKYHEVHGKKIFYPKYGNSFYEALEYNRKLESKNPNPNEHNKLQTEQQSEKKTVEQKKNKNDLVHLLFKNIHK